MPGNVALIDHHRCDPRMCADGLCVAALACPRKLLRQEAPYEVPMTDHSPCRGCADCRRVCPTDAIRLVREGISATHGPSNPCFQAVMPPSQKGVP